MGLESETVAQVTPLSKNYELLYLGGQRRVARRPSKSKLPFIAIYVYNAANYRFKIL